jgi:hypothetical protein
MKKVSRKIVPVFLVLMLFAMILQGGVFAAAQSNVQLLAAEDFSLTADNQMASPTDTVVFTISTNLTQAVANGYRAAKVSVHLPTGLNYESSTVYIGNTPAVITTTPVGTGVGTSVSFDFVEANMTAGPIQIHVTATVASEIRGNALSVSANLFMQQQGLPMLEVPSQQATFTLRIVDALGPTLPPLPEIPITPQVSRVAFNFNGGVRIGGGAQVQAVPVGGAAVEPYVYRDGYVFLGWDTPFNYVTQNILVNALWTLDTGIYPPIVPPIYDYVDGHFIGGRNAFTQQSHMPLIYYAENHVTNFVSVEIDGQTLRRGTHYAVTTATQANTTAIHLKASFMNTLSTGTHTLIVNFRDDLYATAEFTVRGYTNIFTDVSSSDWFYRGVGAMNASELLQGVSANRFDPYSHMTRGMVVTLLYRYAGQPTITGFYNPFPDVNQGQYYANAVIWAAANGIVLGHENGLFAPYEMMTREQFAAVLYRYQNALGSTPMDILMDHQYSDFTQIALFARGAVNKLNMQGVFRDWPTIPGNLFSPENPVNRAEVATVMRYWIESIGW